MRLWSNRGHFTPARVGGESVIIDAFDPSDGEGKHIYVRYRNDDGEVMERIVDDFRPYFFVENLNTERLQALYDANFMLGALAVLPKPKMVENCYKSMPPCLKMLSA